MTRQIPGSGARAAQLHRVATRLRRRRQPAPAQASTSGPSSSPTPTPPDSTLLGETTAPPAPGGTASDGAAQSSDWWTRLERPVTLLVSISTLIAAGAALVTVRQAGSEQGLTRDGQVTDRYTAAVANLGDDNEEVRLGGLYALQRIAQDSPRDASTVVQVVSAFVRSHAPQPKKGTKVSGPPANDVDAALRILAAPLDSTTPVDLHGANLHGAELHDANLHGADLEGANLTEADLGGADLTGAYLEDAYLDAAYLDTADLNHAGLIGAHLPDTELVGANLHNAQLSNASLTHADLSGANLTGAALEGANLTDADLTNADLTGINFLLDANLTGVKGYEPSPGPTVPKTTSTSVR